jgi:hypothetical protein
MPTRILNCSTSLENYYVCLRERVAGFSNRGPQPGDQVYLVVKVDDPIQFGAYIVRLVERITLSDQSAEYALTVQG